VRRNHRAHKFAAALMWLVVVGHPERKEVKLQVCNRFHILHVQMLIQSVLRHDNFLIECYASLCWSHYLASHHALSWIVNTCMRVSPYAYMCMSLTSALCAVHALGESTSAVKSCFKFNSCSCTARCELSSMVILHELLTEYSLLRLSYSASFKIYSAECSMLLSIINSIWLNARQDAETL